MASASSLSLGVEISTMQLPVAVPL
jgi:hypothetical protein